MRVNESFPFLLSFSVDGIILQQLFAWIDDFGFINFCPDLSTFEKKILINFPHSYIQFLYFHSEMPSKLVNTARRVYRYLYFTFSETCVLIHHFGSVSVERSKTNNPRLLNWFKMGFVGIFWRHVSEAFSTWKLVFTHTINHKRIHSMNDIASSHLGNRKLNHDTTRFQMHDPDYWTLLKFYPIGVVHF